MMLPIPTTSMNIACLHSLGFVLGWDTYFRIVRNSLANTRAFHYVMHIGDLIGPEDWSAEYSGTTMPRKDVPLAEKLRRFEQVLNIFDEAGKEVVRMDHLAGVYHDEVRAQESRTGME